VSPKFAPSTLALLVVLALTISTTAGAEYVTISLVQVGGTYDGVQAHPGDTLVLDIQYTVGDQGVILIDPTIAFGAEVTSFDGGTETGVAGWSNGAYALSPIATGDIALSPFDPNWADGWEKASSVAGGAFEPCVGGACTSLGTASFTLSGQAGVIGFAPEGPAGGTVVGYSDPYMICVPGPCWNAVSFTVIPEPATATLLTLGLLALAAASRNRSD
jgi:hypothetical protein